MSVTWLLRTGHDLHLHFQKNTTAAVSWLAVIRAGEPGICFALQVIEHGLLKEDSRTAKKLPLHMLGFVVLAASHNTSRPMWSTPWSLLLCICHLSLLWPLQFHHRSTAGPSSGSLRPRNRLLVIARKQGLLTEESTRRAVMSSAAVGAAASGALLVGAAGFRFGAALVVSGHPSPPQLPSGSFPVGVTEARLGGSGSRIRGRLFYPAQISRPGSEASYFPFGRATSDGLAGLVSFPPFLLAHLAKAKSGCIADAPPSKPAIRATLIYSHGMGGNADMGAYAMRRMASMGIMVVALEHEDGSASFALSETGARVAFDGGKSKGFHHRVHELVLAGTMLKQGLANTCVGEDLAECFDPCSLAVGGHSYGCPTAMAACQEAPELFKHAILHDPAITAGAKVVGNGTLGVPALYVLGDGYRASRRICDGVQAAMLSSGPSSAVWHLQGAEHGNFVDAAFWAPLWVMRNLPFIPAAGQKSPAEVHDELARSAFDFVVKNAAPKGSAGSVQAMLERLTG